MAAVAPDDSTVFVNEVHYDNSGDDVGEAVEVVAPAGTDLAGWTIVAYNGSNGAPYTTVSLTGVVVDQSGGLGTVSVPITGLQNGAPDGIALVAPGGALEQFLSYEGSFTAVGGPANGLVATDIGVAETSSAPVGGSLALTGTGGTYGDFTWATTPTASFGAVNPGQTFSTGPIGPVATCPAELVTEGGVAAGADVSAAAANGAIGTIAITSAPVDGITLTPTGAGTARLDVAATVGAGTYAVVIEFATDDDPAQTTTCTVAVTVTAPLVVSPISQVQGSGSASPVIGREVIVEVVVTSLFERRDVLDGFFVQEEDTDVDGSAATSERIFVFCRGSCPVDLAAGDQVRVQGTAAEFFGMTQINVAAGGTSTLARQVALPSATPVVLPAAGSTRAEATFESLEGMIASFEPLFVSEHFELARFGQVVLSADERPYQFTHDNEPDAEGYAAHVADLATRRIILDDDNNDNNDAIADGPDEPYAFPPGGLSVENRVRRGDRVRDVTGVLHWSFAGATGTDAWRIRPIPGVEPTVETEAAPTTPEPIGGRLRVATFNVLNSFSTIDTTSSNSTGTCGPPLATLDCRGADSAAELERQRAKIVAALAALDGDVVGLIEIQNDDGTTTDDLVAALNGIPGAGPYAAIDTGVIGTDAIKVALIYQPAAVTPVGGFAVLDSTDDPRFIDTLNRPVLIQTFDEVATGARFTVAVNHFKSKGSSCDSVGDPDRSDGQGNCAGTRSKAAAALADHLATDPTGSGDPDFLIVGDLNSYLREDPIRALVAAGYVDLIERFIGDDAYSYLFDGQLGYLDHALASGSLSAQVAGATEWAINADEVPLFDYNDTVDDEGEAAFERESTARELYAPDPRRSSDHDPLVVGLDLDVRNTLAVDGAVAVLRRAGGGTLTLSARLGGAELSSCPVVELRIDGVSAITAATRCAAGSSVCTGWARTGVLTIDRATGELRAVVELPRSFVLADPTVNVTVLLDGEVFTTDVAGRRIGPIWAAG